MLRLFHDSPGQSQCAVAPERLDTRLALSICWNIRASASENGIHFHREFHSFLKSSRHVIEVATSESSELLPGRSPCTTGASRQHTEDREDTCHVGKSVSVNYA